MTRLEITLELVGDIRDCAGRARDQGLTEQASALNKAADDIEYQAVHSERPSSPVLVANIEARANASKHFRAARELLRDIKR